MNTDQQHTTNGEIMEMSVSTQGLPPRAFEVGDPVLDAEGNTIGSVAKVDEEGGSLRLEVPAQALGRPVVMKACVAIADYEYKVVG